MWNRCNFIISFSWNYVSTLPLSVKFELLCMQLIHAIRRASMLHSTRRRCLSSVLAALEDDGRQTRALCQLTHHSELLMCQCVRKPVLTRCVGVALSTLVSLNFSIESSLVITRPRSVVPRALATSLWRSSSRSWGKGLGLRRDFKVLVLVLRPKCKGLGHGLKSFCVVLNLDKKSGSV